MTIICIYHSRDLDGWMSAAIVKKWYLELYLDENTQRISESEDKIVIQMVVSEEVSDTLEFLGWDYGDEIPDLSDYDKVIMCDVSFPPNVMEQLIQDKCTGDEITTNMNFTWIDHHISVIKALDNHLPKGWLFPQGLRDINFAACELTWKHFFPNEEMPEIVRLLGRYDCFGHKGTSEEQKVLEFQYGARQCISNYEEAYNHLIDEANDYKIGVTTVEAIHSNGSVIYRYLCTEAKQIYEKAFPIRFKVPNELIPFNVPGSKRDNDNWKYKFLCVNKNRFNPVNFGINYHKEGYDGFVCFWYNKGKWTFSLYNDDGRVDCSIIAKQYGGGGHKGASGFVCNNETMLKIINNLPSPKEFQMIPLSSKEDIEIKENENDK